jgi:hypothetical protein
MLTRSMQNSEKLINVSLASWSCENDLSEPLSRGDSLPRHELSDCDFFYHPRRHGLQSDRLGAGE